MYSHRRSPRSVSVPGRASALPARPARRRRRTYQFERLEDRMLMTGNSGNGPEFVENLPDPNEPDPNPIVVQATLDAWDDYLQVRLDDVGQSLNVLGNDHSPNGQSSLRARDNLTWPFFGFSGLDGVVPVAVEGVPFEMD